jgi:surface protein
MSKYTYLFLLCFGFCINNMLAQTTLNDNGNWHTINYSGAYEDFLVPANTTYTHIEFILEGGDGGMADKNNNGNCVGYGGQGARVYADFQIGTNATNAKIPFGATIRFIVGGKGENNTNGSGGGGAGGGGGSAVLDVTGAESNYRILAVAGGGGGGESSGTEFFGCKDDDGYNASLSEDGTTDSNDYFAGTNGNGGETEADVGGGGGGGGAFTNGPADDGTLYQIGGRAGGWTGADGGTSADLSGIKAYHGGFGFGSGGGAWDNYRGSNGLYVRPTAGGGGGGGYSGGACGSGGHAGGGGGSYVIPGIYDSYMEIPNTGTEANGNIKYRFINRTDCSPEISSVQVLEAQDCTERGRVNVFRSNDAGCNQNYLDYVLLRQDDPGWQIINPTGVFEDLPVGNYNVKLRRVFAPGFSNVLDEAFFTINTNAGDSADPTPVLQDLTVYLDENGEVTIQAADADNGSYDDCGIDQFLFIETDDEGFLVYRSQRTFTCDNLGTQPMSLVVRDVAGNNLLAFFDLTVEDQFAPTLTDEGELEAINDVNVEIPDGGTITLDQNFFINDIISQFEDKPCTSNLILNSTAVGSTYTCSDVGNSFLHYATVEDQFGNATIQFQIRLNIIESTPVINYNENITLTLDDATGEANLTINDIINSVTNIGCTTEAEIINNYSIPAEYTSFQCHDIGTHIIDLMNASSDLPDIQVTVQITQSTTSPCSINEADFFITTWQVSGDETARTITIPTTGSGYNYRIDWGDNTIASVVTGSATHTYSTNGTYTVKIIGDFPRIFFNETGDDRHKIKTIQQWGSIAWTSMTEAFEGCTQLDVTAVDTPNLSNATSLQNMFKYCNAMVGTTAFNNWNVDTITNMRGTFYDCDGFNQYIGDWNVSNVDIMDSMFAFSDNYNQPFTNWNTASLQNARWMFRGATSFNQDLSHWNVSNLSNAASMFRTATSFDQDLGAWDISSLTNGANMFADVALSQNNYDNLLLGWSTLDAGETQIPTTISFHAGNSQYCIGESARNILTNDAGLNWNITDTGSNCTETFISVWNTANPGTSANTQITIPVSSSETYNYNIDWGDGTADKGVTGSITHTYSTASTYTIKVSGTFPRIYFSYGGDTSKITEIQQWGRNPWTSMEGAFAGCNNLDVTATDAPDLTGVTNLQEMFNSCQNLQGTTAFNTWDVAAITNMTLLFGDTPLFNQSLSDWNVSNAQDMNLMFYKSGFNQDVSNWNVGNVQNMDLMFSESSFNNASLNNWNVAQVTTMFGMFQNTSFNQDISGWNVSNVTNMNSMFQGNTSFDQDLANWDVSSLDTASSMFLGATLSYENYDSLLNAWSQLTLQADVVFSGGNSNFCLSEDKRQHIIDTFNWTITDGGKACPQITVPNIVNLTEVDATTTLNTDQFELGTIEYVYSATVPTGLIISQTPAATTDADLGSDVNVVMSKGTFPIKITGILSGDHLTGTETNAIELYVTEDIADLSSYAISTESGGNGSDGPEFYLSGSATAGDFIYLTTNNTDFQNFFGFTADFEMNMSGIAINGGTAVELFIDQLGTTSLVDAFGDVNASGFTQSWRYTRRWAYRKNNTGPDSGFIASNWRMLPYSVFLDDSNVTTNSVAPVPFPLGTYGQAYDSTSPVANCQNITVEIADECLEITGNDINNNSTDDTGIALILIQELPSGFADLDVGLCCADLGNNQVNLIVFDAAGNVDTCTTNINVTLAPTQIVCQDISIALDLTGNASIGVFDVIDEFTGMCTSEGSSFYLTTTNPASGSGNATFSDTISTSNPIDDLGGSNNPDDQFYYTTDTFTVPVDGNYAPNFNITTNNQQPLFVIISSTPIVPNSGSVDTRTGFMNGFVYEAPGNYLGSFDGNDEVALVANTTYYIQFVTQDTPMTFSGSISQGSNSNTNSDTHAFTTANMGDNTLYVVATDPTGFTSYCQTTVTVNAPEPFTTIWKTDNAGTSDNLSIEIPTNGSGYDYQIDWGDGTVETGLTGNATHTYATAGTYTVAILGDFPGIYFNNGGDKSKLLEVANWGVIEWRSMERAFFGCNNLVISATDAPNLSNVTNMEMMLRGAGNSIDINSWADITTWDVSTIQDMSSLFRESNFNQNIAVWTVDNVLDMKRMFQANSAFNQNISSWNVSNVTNMFSMFFNASNFNQDISTWNTNKVENMRWMFRGASQFDQNLATWDISSIQINMGDMFTNSGLSPDNYDNIILGWSEDTSGPPTDGIDDIPINVTFGAGTTTYCISASRRASLVNKGWTITDGGLGCNFNNAFTMLIDTSMPGESNSQTFRSRSLGNRVIDWGDGIINSSTNHTYAAPGIYTVKITGEFQINFIDYDDEATDAAKILEIQQWGDNKWSTMAGAFYDCANLQVTATDVPDLSQCSSLSFAFNRCTSLGNTDAFANWDVSTINNTLVMFANSSFNGDISGWNTANLQVADGMFSNATNFNQNLGNWDLSSLYSPYDMLKNTNLSVENYDNILIGWSTDTSGIPNDGIDDIPTNLSFSTINAKYCDGADARILLTDTYGWGLGDQGIANNCASQLIGTPFVTTWKTDNPGTSDDLTIEIPTTGDGYYYHVDWGDGAIDNGITGNATHTYATAGTYTVAVYGDFPRIFFNGTGDNEKIVTIEQWGDMEWTSMQAAFEDCTNLNITNPAIDAPDLALVTTLEDMFYNCSSFNGNVTNWDVSTIEIFDEMFGYCVVFNQNIGTWNMSSATSLYYMFYEAYTFNQPIGTWNVSNVINMEGVFSDALAFNQPLDSWNVSNVQTMDELFYNAIAFNQDLNSWNVSNVTNMEQVFNFAAAFNGNISSWDVSNAITMEKMFAAADAFNQDISTWNTIAVTNMAEMFSGAENFNQNIGNWEVNKVQDMSGMFTNADSFDQNLGNWGISSLTDATAMFGSGPGRISLSTENYDNTLIGWSDDTSGFLDDGVDDVPTNVTFGGGASTYCTSTNRRSNLLNKGWVITDGGQSCNFDNALILVINTEIAGESNNQTFRSRSFGNRVTDWGDGNVDASANHTYAAPGIYTVKITGEFRINFVDYDDEETDAAKILEIQQWGDNKWSSMAGAFYDCANLQITATDVPDISQCSTLSFAFNRCTSLGNTDAFNNWDVSTITNMQSMFANSTFNGDISGWNTANLNITDGMFYNNTNFNQDIGSWDLGNLYSAYDMLRNTSLSVENYDNALIGWNTDSSGVAGDGIDDIPMNVYFNQISAKYCAGADAKTSLTNTHGWGLVDQGQDDNCKAVIAAKVYLQGATLNPHIGEENLMRDDLRVAGLIPTRSPYADMISCELTVFDATGNDAIVDWVWVELRDATDNTLAVDAQSALLQRDGDIVAIDGSTALTFDMPSGEYYIVIKHRNHLGIMSANAITLTNTGTSVDFTDDTTPTFGSNAQTNFGMPSGMVAMWTGNINDDAIIQYSGISSDTPNILSEVLNDSGNFLNLPTYVVNGYKKYDINMDGNTQYSGTNPDTPIILQNALTHPGNVLNFSTYQITEQLPENE